MATVLLVLYAAFFPLGFLLLFRIPTCKRAQFDPLDCLRVSIIIPARNEEKNLPCLLASLGAQTFRPEEVIVVDDGSEDATAALAREAGAKLIQVGELPPGWTGKPWACWCGAREAQGEILVFLDADTRLERDGLTKIVDTYREKGGVVSVQPYHRMERVYEQLSAFFNIIVVAGLNAFTILGTRLHPSGAFGPCMAIGKADYFATGGHEQVKGEVLEDVAIGQLYRKKDVQVRCYGGRGALSFRMYPQGLRQLIEGHSKGFAQGAQGISIPALLLLVLWIAGGAGATRTLIVAALFGDHGTMILALSLYVLYAGQLYWMLARIGSFHVLTAFLYPLPLLFFVGVFLYSLVITRWRRKVSWKGRTISTRT